MAKRFTDSEKWKDEWYISLTNDYKIIWQWLLDNCTHSGLCKRSMSLLNLMCKTDIGEKDMIAVMENRVLIIEDYWFIPKFLKFQYSTLLSNKPAIVSVVRELFKHNLIGIIPESFGNDYKIISKSFDNHCQMIKDKDKDKDKKGGLGENKEGDGKKGKRLDVENGVVFFGDASYQKLGPDQLFMAKRGELQAREIVKGQIY